MRERIATALGLALDQVNVKAKTAEKLGPVGQQQAMEARPCRLLFRRLTSGVPSHGGPGDRSTIAGAFVFAERICRTRAACSVFSVQGAVLRTRRQLVLDLRALQTLLGLGTLGHSRGTLQLHMGDQPARGGVGQRKHAAHALHRFVHDGQAQARARCGRARGVATEEGLGQAGQLLGGTPRPWSRMRITTQLSRSDAVTSTWVVSVSRGSCRSGVRSRTGGDHARQFHLVGQYIDAFGHGHADLQLRWSCTA
ncbi:Anaphase-promoting complex subunit 5 [Manis javanica]|nr:Anaphase-promoting complex subunit 5 [Manis javanica]